MAFETTSMNQLVPRKSAKFWWALIAFILLAFGLGIGFVAPVDALSGGNRRNGNMFAGIMTVFGEWPARYVYALPFLVMGAGALSRGLVGPTRETEPKAEVSNELDATARPIKKYAKRSAKSKAELARKSRSTRKYPEARRNKR
jgi:hypothetical protein